MIKFYSDTDIDSDFPCETNITGICLKNTNLQQCSELCKNHPNCKWAVYNHENKICKPVDENFYPKFNPLLNLVSKFGNTTIIKNNFEISHNNRLFYYDIVKLKDITNNIILEPPITFMHNLPFLYNKKSITYISSDELVSFSNDATNKILIPETSKVSWLKKYRISQYSFYIVPINSENRTDLYYSDIFEIFTPTKKKLCNISGNKQIENLIINNDGDNNSDCKFMFILLSRNSEFGT